jgi:hypothetical protein
MLRVLMLTLVLPLQLGQNAELPLADTKPKDPVLAQFVSPRCATPAGICFVSPMPVGSPCQCGQYFGTIIP